MPMRGQRRTGVKRIHHPVVGDLQLTYEAMELPSDPGLTMFAFLSEPATVCGRTGAVGELGSHAARICRVARQCPRRSVSAERKDDVKTRFDHCVARHFRDAGGFIVRGAESSAGVWAPLPSSSKSKVASPPAVRSTQPRGYSIHSFPPIPLVRPITAYGIGFRLAVMREQGVKVATDHRGDDVVVGHLVKRLIQDQPAVAQHHHPVGDGAISAILWVV